MVDRILLAERCADAAFSSHMENLKKRMAQLEENSIWGPLIMPPKRGIKDTLYGCKISETNGHICSDRKESFEPLKFDVSVVQLKEIKSSSKSDEDTIASISKFSEPVNKDNENKKDIKTCEVKILKDFRAEIPEQHANTNMDEQQGKHLGNQVPLKSVGILNQNSLKVINNVESKVSQMKKTPMSDVNKVSYENYDITDTSINKMQHYSLNQNSGKKLEIADLKQEEIILNNYECSSDNPEENNQGFETDKIYSSCNSHLKFYKGILNTKREFEGNFKIEKCAAPDIYEEFERSNPTLNTSDSDESETNFTNISKSSKSNNFQSKGPRTNKRSRNRSGGVMRVYYNSAMNIDKSAPSSQVPDTENQNAFKTETDTYPYISSKRLVNAERDFEGRLSKVHKYPPKDIDNKLNKRLNRKLKTLNKNEDTSQTKIYKNSKCDNFQTEILKNNIKTRNRSGDADAEDEPLLIVEIADEKTDKSHQIIATYSDILRIKKHNPKLRAILPEVDDCKRIDYSADALNIILRYVFNQRSRNFEKMLSPTIIIEAIAAAKEWEVWEFEKLLQENLLQKILNVENAKLVYAYACHFNLEEISNISKSLIEDINFDYQTFRKKQKSSLVSISTHVEPLEIGIPFNEIEKDFSVNFDRTIKNTFTFKAISGCYVIKGFQVQLNENYLEKNDGSLKIKIDYCTKNVSNNRVVEIKRQEKPLRPINIIYFKEKFVIKPREIGEITVETDTKPYLCSEYFQTEMPIKNKFNLMIDSDFRLMNSDKKVFIIAKLFYHRK